MANKPVIFISATSDLRSARDLVGKVLYSMGFEPVWQEIAATDGGELLDVLRKRIEPAALVIQLVGQRYGAEPPQPTADFGRVSYTQFEALEAERLGKKVIYHFLDDHFPVDPAATELPEFASLQAAYRQRLKDTNRLRYDQIVDERDLKISIYEIKDELAELRLQADRRDREFVDRLDKQTAELAELREELRKAVTDVTAAVSPKPLAAAQTQPDPIPPEILAQARLLLERGNAEQQALGMIALKQHEEADRLIQQLKSKPGNPIDEAFRLLALEGDNWYQAGDPDKALGPYEQAFALKPDDLAARTKVIWAHTFARLGNAAAHRQRVVDVCKQALTLVPSGSADWARIQLLLGTGWPLILASTEAEAAENTKRAIAAYGAALTVYTKEGYPDDWAAAQSGLGLAWSGLSTGDKAENLEKAIAAYEAALTVYTKDGYPAEWAA
ncbi:MAG TPA: DUF4062 domain-containing protein, partial [Pirellulales bacterium]|nr:DUF4062 domain-containing protein [Pirellulales bacterium]